MTLAPEVRALLDWEASLGGRLDGLGLDEIRAEIASTLAEHGPAHGVEVADVAIEELVVPVEGAEIRLRLYRPDGPGPHPVFFHIHGGGFTLGSIDWFYNHAKCAHLCAAVGCAVGTVEYRLAPESPFPTGPEDCYAALAWLAEHAGDLRLDRDRIAVGGESAGGNLAAVVALMARDRGGPRLVLQLLEVPVADMSAESSQHASLTFFGEGYGLERAGIDAFQDDYLPPSVDRRSPYVSPLYADLRGVAPAHVMTAELDPLRDSGEALARRLIEAGVRTTAHRHLGHTHGSAVLWSSWQPAADWLGEVVAALRGALPPEELVAPRRRSAPVTKPAGGG